MKNNEGLTKTKKNQVTTGSDKNKSSSKEENKLQNKDKNRDEMDTEDDKKSDNQDSKTRKPLFRK
jgi:hypothetical protein